MTTDEQIAAIRERMAEWDSETCYYTVIHFDHAQAIEDIRFLLAAVDDRDAMIAKLTAERDAAAEVNSKWIWRIGDAIGCDGSWGEVLNAIIAMRIERDAAAAKERERIACWMRFYADFNKRMGVEIASLGVDAMDPESLRLLANVIEEGVADVSDAGGARWAIGGTPNQIKR